MSGSSKKLLNTAINVTINFNEIIRVIDSMQLTEKHPVATPVNWKKGQEVIIKPSVNEEEAKKLLASVHIAPCPAGCYAKWYL